MEKKEPVVVVDPKKKNTTQRGRYDFKKPYYNILFMIV